MTDGAAAKCFSPLRQKGRMDMPEAPSASLYQQLPKLADAVRRWFHAVRSRRRERRLTLCETVSLGDKRYVAVVQFERQRFLLGVTPQSVALLQTLGEDTPHAPNARGAETSGESF